MDEREIVLFLCHAVVTQVITMSVDNVSSIGDINKGHNSTSGMTQHILMYF